MVQTPGGIARRAPDTAVPLGACWGARLGPGPVRARYVVA
jgi:hypothetical protein